MFHAKRVLEFCSVVQTNVLSLYAFHLDTQNLPLITPPGTQATIVSIDLPLRTGSVIELDIKRLGFTTRWKMEVAALEAPSLLCDRALQSPFSHFVHEHRFSAVDEKSSMLCDRVEFSLPFYPLSLLLLPLLYRDMRKMFAYRHERTKFLLETEQRSSHE
jgi:ligand-binding SRPBCC domain-containing protein